MNNFWEGVVVGAYNLALLCGTVWLIVEHDWSKWWILLALLLMASTTGRDD